MSTFAPADRSALDMAINAWISTGGSLTAGTAYNNVTINSWDVSAITNMADLFFGKTTFNSNIGSWNVSNVTDMSNMFCAASAFDQNIRTWHVGQWSNLNGMFGGATAMQQNRGASATPLYTWFDDGHVPPAPTGPTTRDQLIFVFGAWGMDPTAAAAMYGQPNTWNVSAVTDMSGVYYSSFVPYNFNSDISSWNVSNVTNMSGMFQFVSAFDQNIRGWSVGQSTNLGGMFTGATAMQNNQGASDTPLYTYFNQGSAPAPTFAPATKIELQAAVDAWCSDSAAATATYGDINTWNVSAITDMSYLFISKMSFNSNISSWNVSNVTTMYQMFNEALAFNQPLNSWNVGNVTTMYQMFNGAMAFNQPLNSWNMSRVTNINGMFRAMNPEFNQPLNLWNVSQVTDMAQMFYNATAFNQPLNSWNVSQVTNMGGMFYNAAAFNQPLNSWNMSRVTNMGGMFILASAFNQPLDLWNVSLVTNMGGMFESATAFDRNIRGWSVGQSTNLGGMFTGATAMQNNQGASETPLYTYFNQGSAPLPTSTKIELQAAVDAWCSDSAAATATYGDINTWNVSAITDMSYLFISKMSFNSNISSWNVSNVTNMVSMFNNATEFNQPLNSWDVSKVTNMTYMFSSARNFNQPLNLWNVSNVTLMGGMFSGVTAFNQPLNSWNVSKVTDMSSMFYATAFNQPLNSWNVSIVTNMTNMFNNVGAFDENIRMWSVGQGTTLTNMFYGATAMQQNRGASDTPLYTYFNQTPAPLPTATRTALDTAITAWISNPTTATATYGPINSWDVSAITDMSNLFAGKVAFNSNISSWNVSNVTNMAGMFMMATAFNQPLNSWDVSRVTNMIAMFNSASNFDQNIRMWSVGQTTNLSTIFSGATLLLENHGALPLYTYFNQGSAPAPTPTGPELMPVAFVLPQLNASFELSEVLSVVGEYTAPDAYALPTITLTMHAIQFNGGLFQLALTDSNIHTLASPATEAVYVSEKITYYANDGVDKFPLLKNDANVLLKDLPVVNGNVHVSKTIRQREELNKQSLPESMIHELAYQLTGVSKMDDQLANGEALKTAIRTYLDSALPTFIKAQLGNCNGKTQNISGASDMTGSANVSRELFMQIVKSVVGGVNPSTGSMKSSRLTELFASGNYDSVTKRYGIKLIAGDTLRFSITISPYSAGGVVADVDVIVDGLPEPKQEARTVELVITLV